MGPDGPKWGQEDFVPTNPDLADILGRTDFDFEKFYFFHFLVSISNRGSQSHNHGSRVTRTVELTAAQRLE